MQLLSTLVLLRWPPWPLLLALAFLWYRLIDQLRLEWTVNEQYTYGWAVPFLCLYLLWEKLKTRKAEKLKSEQAETTRSGQTGSSDSEHSEKPNPGNEAISESVPSVPPTSHLPSSIFHLPSPIFALLFALCLALYAPTRLIQEANPEWRLVSWALALQVVGITWIAVQSALLLFHLPSPISHLRRSDFTFPLLFFLVAVPWPTIIEGPVVQGLARANAASAVEVLSLLGIPAFQRGNMIEVGAGVVGIDEGCSGIRSLQVSLMLSLFLGALYQLSVLRRVTLCLLGFLLSFLFNLARTTLLTWVAAKQGTKAIASWHDPAGTAILVACFVSLWLLALLLKRMGDRRWKIEDRNSAAQSPTSHLPSPTSHLRPVVSWSLLIWILVVEAGTEFWYRSHERRIPVTAAWQVVLPRDNPTFRDRPFSKVEIQMLRYDEGVSGVWREDDGTRWQAIFLRWNPGRISTHLAKSHTPEICLTAAGRNLVSKSDLHLVPVHGLELPFRSYLVRDENGPIHVFYCLWEDRADTQGFASTTLTYGNRLAPVLAGRRNSGQRSLEIAIWGIDSQEDAQAALARQLQRLIQRADETEARPPGS